jgi:hypothetical protein
MNRTIFYTGVGSRKTPKSILDIMRALAARLESAGWTLRSGGADGADSAFESGTNKKTIYYANQATPASMAIAAKFHPAWDRCSDFAKRLHGRNSFQVLGKTLDRPSKFLVCWTSDGCTSHQTRTITTGGTGTAISIADNYGVEIFNLANSDHLARIVKFIKGD